MSKTTLMPLVVMIMSIVAITLIAGCANVGDAATTAAAADDLEGRLVLTGSSTMAPLVGEIAKRFEARHANVRIDVQTGGSSRGIADATRGIADIGMSSRTLDQRERAGMVETLLARDGVCFIVHASNPIASLTRDELVGIYTGQIQNWREVGGYDGPITVIDRAAGRSETTLVAAFLDFEPGSVDADVIAGENQQGIKLVAGDPNAITYMSVGTSEYEASNGTAIALLPLDGIAATSASVASGAFPLSRPLVFVHRTEHSTLQSAFLEFATSHEVHDLVQEQSFVPIER
ncbi:MAG: phosphate ABC transporter substrate-binding protein [Planctomycetota bacterium]